MVIKGTQREVLEGALSWGTMSKGEQTQCLCCNTIKEKKDWPMSCMICLLLRSGDLHIIHNQLIVPQTKNCSASKPSFIFRKKISPMTLAMSRTQRTQSEMHHSKPGLTGCWVPTAHAPDLPALRYQKQEYLYFGGIVGVYGCDWDLTTPWIDYIMQFMYWCFITFPDTYKENFVIGIFFKKLRSSQTPPPGPLPPTQSLSKGC